MASSSRGAAWGEKETKTLILIWGDIKIQAELDGKSRTKQVFEQISLKMTEEGYNRDGEQCTIKIKNLKKAYTAVKDHNNVIGNDKKTCPFFEDIRRCCSCTSPSISSNTGPRCYSAGGIAVEPNDERGENDRDYGMVEWQHVLSFSIMHLHTEEDARGSQREPEGKILYCYCNFSSHPMIH